MITRGVLILFVVSLIASCSEVQEVDSEDWRRYEWMREILGDQVNVEGATHNVDTGEYKFDFTTRLPADSTIDDLDRRATQAGWLIENRDDLSRVYVRHKQSSAKKHGLGCIHIQPQPEGIGFKFQYRSTFDCEGL